MGRRRSRANPGRVAAAKALVAAEQGAFLEDVLERHAPDAPRDRGLAWFLARGVNQRRAHVDAALRPHLKRALTGLDAEIRAALRLGAFELLYARTKRHAAVDQGVEVAKALGLGRAKGMVNAVLRRVKPPENLSRPDALDHPAWLVARWDERYGEDATTAWCEANAEPAPLTLVLKPGVELDIPHEDTDVPGVVRLTESAGHVVDLPGFAEGAFWVQDLAAVKVADLVPAEGRVLDACAAPGGKSFRLTQQGAEVVAVDVSEDRLERVGSGAKRLGLTVETRVHDWSAGPMGAETFDSVLVDAPCTALGLVRRHPEIRWRRQALDIFESAERQAEILRNAATHVAPGGALVYAVCSPEPEEGPEVVQAFLDAHGDFALEQTLSTAPPQHGEDAHYAARMRRAT